MKHVGRMKNNGAKVVIAYRTIPGDPYSALVVGTNGLPDSHHDSLMSLIESDTGQQANELADIMSVRRFPDGTDMLSYVHTNGLLIKVATNAVLVTPDNKTQIPLDELNNVIAEQKGVALEDLAIKDGANATVPTIAEKGDAAPTVDNTSSLNVDLTPSEMRSRADALYKEAAKLRKTADELDPPKKKVKEDVKEDATA
jgi:hypothetical protein